MPDAETPTAWRAAALAVLGGGVLLGERAATGGGWRVLAGLLGLSLAAWVGPIALASRRPPIPPRPPGWRPEPPGPTFTVVVTARDEAPVVAAIVRDVAGQDHRDEAGLPCFDLVVIDDRSTDGTGDAALAAARAAGIESLTRVVRREGEDLSDGKGAALTALPPDACGGDWIVVLDADARIGPSFLSTLAWYAAAGAEGITARRRVAAPAGDELAGAQADEQTADGLIQRGRWALGGCSEFRGNGIVVRRDVLADVGGWRAEALTEDLDLSSRVAARRGTIVAWAIDAEVGEQPVRDWPGLWRQRLRWAEGAVRRALEHGPAVLASQRLPLRARADFAAYAGQLAVAPVLVGVLAGSLRAGDLRPSLACGGLYLAAGTALAWDALRWEAGEDDRPLASTERGRRAVRAAAFGTIWLAAVPGALWRLATRRGPVRYDKMAHDAADAT